MFSLHKEMPFYGWEDEDGRIHIRFYKDDVQMTTTVPDSATRLGPVNASSMTEAARKLKEEAGSDAQVLPETEDEQLEMIMRQHKRFMRFYQWLLKVWAFENAVGPDVADTLTDKSLREELTEEIEHLQRDLLSIQEDVVHGSE